MTTEEVMQALHTGREGLTDAEAQRRLKEVGPNKLIEEKRVTPLTIFLSQFRSVLVIMLIISAAISGLLLGEYVDAALITLIVIMNAILGFVQEYRAERAIEALKRMTAQRATVIRQGKEAIVDAEALVPGDIVVLETGGRIPADARLLETVELQTDEAPLTGESTPVVKETPRLDAAVPVTDRRNMTFMGTSVGYGRGKAIIVRTGMATEFGKIAGAVQTIKEEAPPIKQKVEQLGRQLGLVAIVSCAFVAVVYAVLGYNLVEVLMVSVSLAVSAVPEGLPAVITITLAIGASRMARSHAVVRKLASVETLGCTTAICSDKTGTLTKNEMTIRKIATNDLVVDVTGTGYEPTGSFLRAGEEVTADDAARLEPVLRIAALCNNAVLESGPEGWQIVGDPTEGALVVAAAKAGLWRNKLEEAYPRIGEFPFESARKRMSTIHRTPAGETVAYVKGAPEVIVELCTHFDEAGQVRELRETDRAQILLTTQRMAEAALRVLAMAYKALPGYGNEETAEDVESHLVFIGLAGMIDPPREEVVNAIALCRKAGIKSFMITGDHKLTAVAVGKEIGLLKSEEDNRVLTGTELDQLSDEALNDVVDDVVIYARTSPVHKVRIAQALKNRGHVVAMTGDGVNDAPAIKTADIGVAMGIKGTDVTKEASDMVLEDDNFATIVGAVEAGRQIYDNIRKFVRLMLAVNFDEILEITLAALMGIPLPIIPVQILWINLVTDGLPAAALSVDPKDPAIMSRPPRNPKHGLLHGMLGFILFVAVLDFCSDFIPFMWLYYTTGDVLRARTIAFTIVVFFEFLLALNCRSETRSILRLGWKGLTANKLLLLSIVGGLLLQLAIVYVPFLQPIFHTTALSAGDLIIVLACSSIGLAILPELFIFQ
jgi:Ca2+-transporting ATPase